MDGCYNTRFHWAGSNDVTLLSYFEVYGQSQAPWPTREIIVGELLGDTDSEESTRARHNYFVYSENGLAVILSLPRQPDSPIPSVIGRSETAFEPMIFVQIYCHALKRSGHGMCFRWVPP